MSEIVETEFITETKQRLLAARSSRKKTSAQVYVNMPVMVIADLVRELGAQAMLAFLAIQGSYNVASPRERTAGVTVRTSFRKATGMGNRQFRRAVARLHAAKYIEADTAPGRRARVHFIREIPRSSVSSR